jgi:hypothetical protein
MMRSAGERSRRLRRVVGRRQQYDTIRFYPNGRAVASGEGSVVSGLEQALDVGTRNAVGLTSRENGYLEVAIHKDHSERSRHSSNG